jgi:hypothetical protein
MPVNTIQIQKLLGKHTFQQLRITVNELIDVVNGLPSTVRGDITRQGGVIDGNSSGVIPIFDPGNLLITGSGGLGIGNFLGTDDPNLIGQLHINRSTGDARLNLSQNTATGITYISLQASNTATDPQANNFGFLAATSNTTSQYGMVVLSTANTNQEVSHIFARESWGWGNTADTTSATRLTLTSGENVGLAPHGGPTAHLAAQLRVDRALANDGQTTNTAPIISARGYSASYGGLGNNQTPVRITIGDRNDSEGTTANTYAALDFLADGADTTTENSIGARISAEYTREERTTSALEFSVRNGSVGGTLEKVMKILPGGEITGNDSKAAVMISNTYYLDAATSRGANMGGTSLYTSNAQFGQLIVQQTAQGGFPRQGILVRGNDDENAGTNTGMARLAMENPLARYAEGQKWDFRVEDTNATSSRFEINTYPDNDWTATPNTQFSIQVTNDNTIFTFGNRTGESAGGGAKAGATLLLDGGYNLSGEGAQIEMDTNRAYQQGDVNRHPTTWAIDNKNARLRIFPRNINGFSDTNNPTGPSGYNVTSNDSAFWFTKSTTSNTMIGLGVVPGHSLHILRTYESANVVVESTFSATSPRDESTSRILATGQASDFTVIQAVNPNRTYGSATTQATQHEAGVNIVASKSGSGRADTTLRTIYSSTHDDDGNENQISIRTHSTGGPGDNLGWDIDAVTLIGETGYAASVTYPHLGVPLADRAEYATFGINLRRGQAPGSDIHRALTLTSEGYLAVGRRDLSSGTSAGNRVLQSPGFNLDLSGYRPVGSTTANTLIAFSSESGTSTTWSSWTMGIDQSYTGIAKTTNPFVLSSRVSRGATQQRGTITNLGAAQDGMFVVESRTGAEDRIQTYQIGVRDDHNTLTVYTPANTTSPNWDGSYAGRVGIGNTFPAHTLTVNGHNADSSGIGVYGANAAIRFIEPEPAHPSFLWAGSDVNGALKDPGGAGVAVSERTYHIGSRNGSLVIAQQLGPNDTDIHDSAKAATLSVHANTGVVSVTNPGAAADQRINFSPGLGEDHIQNGSVGINANNVPLASGLFVGDYSKASENRRFVFEDRAYYPATASNRWNFLAGSYPTLSVLSGRPLSQANGAFKTVSVAAAITSNNADASGTFEAGTGEIIKRIEGVRRFSEGYIPGAVTSPPTTSRADANTVAWFDGIGVDNKFSIPAPAIGSEFLGTAASDTTPGTPNPQNIATQSTKVWWERRAHQDNEGEGTDYQNREFSESHLFGSSNNHVMTIHANTSYQGVHVEKGGIYANNSVIAWARLRPRGDVDALVTTETLIASDGYASPATLAWDGHNIETITKVGIGRFELTLPAEWRNGNNYSVMVTGTSNLYLAGLGQNVLDDGNLTASELDNVLYRRRQFEVEYDGSDAIVDPGQIIGLADNVGEQEFGNADKGALSTHHVRVANDQVIQVETRTPISDWQIAGNSGRHSTNPSTTALIDEDEVYIVVIGSVDPTNFRG